MKKLKVRNYHLAILILLFTLTACSNEKDANEVVPAKDAEESKDEAKKSDEESDEEAGFQIIETMKIFGGDTFNIDDEIKDVSGIYVSEREENVFLSFEDNDHYHVVSGNKEGWKSISEELNTGHPYEYVRGEMFYTTVNNQVITNKFSFDDVKKINQIGEGVSAEKFALTDTSQGEGVIIETGEQSYALYIDNKLTLEFEDSKDFFNDGFHDSKIREQQMYVDIEKQKLFFARSFGDYGVVNAMDLNTGESIFTDGKVKELETARSVDIIGDGKGNLFVVEYGDSVRVSVYDSELDLLVEPFEVTVTNPDEIAVTVAEDEVHIWNYHQYEIEPALELVRLSKPSLLGSVDVTSSSDKDEQKSVVRAFLESGNNRDMDTFRSYLVEGFGEEVKENIEEDFFGNGDDFSFEIVEILETRKIPSDLGEISEEKLSSYKVNVDVTEGGRGEVSVNLVLYQEEDGWKVIKFN